MKRYLPFAIILFVAATALSGGAYLFRTKRVELEKTLSAATTANPGAQPPHVQGPAKAIVTLEEFGDFQCPPCANVALNLLQLEKEYGSQLRVIFRNFPLEMHNHAAEAARAAEAAGLQGKFWEMHALLYRNQVAWSREANVKPVFEAYAQTIGLDPQRFQKDLEGKEAAHRVNADRQRGTALGVSSTPTFFLNGRSLPPSSLNDKALKAAVAAAVRGEDPLPLVSPSPVSPPPTPPAPTPSS